MISNGTHSFVNKLIIIYIYILIKFKFQAAVLFVCLVTSVHNSSAMEDMWPSYVWCSAILLA